MKKHIDEVRKEARFDAHVEVLSTSACGSSAMTLLGAEVTCAIHCLNTHQTLLDALKASDEIVSHLMEVCDLGSACGLKVAELNDALTGASKAIRDAEYVEVLNDVDV